MLVVVIVNKVDFLVSYVKNIYHNGMRHNIDLHLESASVHDSIIYVNVALAADLSKDNGNATTKTISFMLVAQNTEDPSSAITSSFTISNDTGCTHILQLPNPNKLNGTFKITILNIRDMHSFAELYSSANDVVVSIPSIETVAYEDIDDLNIQILKTSSSNIVFEVTNGFIPIPLSIPIQIKLRFAIIDRLVSIHQIISSEVTALNDIFAGRGDSLIGVPWQEKDNYHGSSISFETLDISTFPEKDTNYTFAEISALCQKLDGAHDGVINIVIIDITNISTMESSHLMSCHGDIIANSIVLDVAYFQTSSNGHLLAHYIGVLFGLPCFSWLPNTHNNNNEILTRNIMCANQNGHRIFTSRQFAEMENYLINKGLHDNEQTNGQILSAKYKPPIDYDSNDAEILLVTFDPEKSTHVTCLDNYSNVMPVTTMTYNNVSQTNRYHFIGLSAGRYQIKNSNNSSIDIVLTEPPRLIIDDIRVSGDFVKVTFRNSRGQIHCQLLNRSIRPNIISHIDNDGICGQLSPGVYDVIVRDNYTTLTIAYAFQILDNPPACSIPRLTNANGVMPSLHIVYPSYSLTSVLKVKRGDKLTFGRHVYLGDLSILIGSSDKFQHIDFTLPTSKFLPNSFSSEMKLHIMKSSYNNSNSRNVNEHWTNIHLVSDSTIFLTRTGRITIANDEQEARSWSKKYLPFLPGILQYWILIYIADPSGRFYTTSRLDILNVS